MTGGVVTGAAGPPESPRGGRRSVLVRLVARVTSRQPQDQPSRWRGWLLTRLGRSPQRGDLSTECRQCGQWASVSVFRLGPRRARYWCQRCGAVVSLPDRAALRPVAELRDPPAAPPPAAPPASPDGGDLREVMPPAMAQWVQARSRRPVTLDRLDKSTVYQRYREWDAEQPDAAGLPAFSVVVGALHESCYHADLAARSVSDRPDAPDLRERLEHARRWLALRGQRLCWIHSRVPAGGLATPERTAVEAAIAALRNGAAPGTAESRAARAALFGTDGGPGLPALLRAYPAPDMLAALADYLASGARPLRADVLARLAAPLDLPAGGDE